MRERSQILSNRLHATFASLRNRNFRIYFAAQIGSNVGTWIQITAEELMIAVCCGLLSIVHVWRSLPLGIYFSLAGMFLLDVSWGFSM